MAQIVTQYRVRLSTLSPFDGLETLPVVTWEPSLLLKGEEYYELDTKRLNDDERIQVMSALANSYPAPLQFCWLEYGRIILQSDWVEEVGFGL